MIMTLFGTKKPITWTCYYYLSPIYANGVGDIDSFLHNQFDILVYWTALINWIFNDSCVIILP